MRLRFLIPFLCLSAGIACAQDNPRLALAHEVTQAMQITRMFDGMSTQMEQMVLQMVPPGGTPEEQARVKAMQVKVMALALEAVKGLLPQIDQIYADVYSEGELKAMKAFYSSPEGTSMVQKQPLVLKQMTPLIIQMQRDLIPKIQAIAQGADDAGTGAGKPN